MSDKTHPSTPLDELIALADAVDARKPDPQAVAELRRCLDAQPRLTQVLGDATSRIQRRLIEQITPSRTYQMAIEIRAAAVRDGLGYQGATQLEQLLIEHAVLCWLRLQQVEQGYTAAMERSLPLPQADYWDRHLSAAQRRFNRACDTLTRARRLLNPTLQVNIAAQGGQQVNLSGDLHLDPGNAA